MPALPETAGVLYGSGRSPLTLNIAVPESLEKFPAAEKEKPAKPPFKEAVEAIVKRMQKENHLFYDIKAFTHCLDCKKEIALESTDYEQTPEGIPFCSAECFTDKVHPLPCTCTLYGSQEELYKLADQIDTEQKRRGTDRAYSLRQAKNQILNKSRDAYLEKLTGPESDEK